MNGSRINFKRKLAVSSVGGFDCVVSAERVSSKLFYYIFYEKW